MQSSTIGADVPLPSQSQRGTSHGARGIGEKEPGGAESLLVLANQARDQAHLGENGQTVSSSGSSSLDPNGTRQGLATSGSSVADAGKAHGHPPRRKQGLLTGRQHNHNNGKFAPSASGNATETQIVMAVITGFLAKNWLSLPKVTRGLAVVVFIGAIVALFGGAPHTALCPQHFPRAQSFLSIPTSSSHPSPSIPASASPDLQSNPSSSLHPKAYGAYSSEPTIKSLLRLALYPLVTPHLGLAVLILFGIITTASSLERGRGSLYLIHSLAILSILNILIFVSVYLMLARVVSLLSLPFLSPYYSFGLDCTSSFLCASGADLLLFPLILIEAKACHRPHRYIVGWPHPLPTVLIPIILWLTLGLFHGLRWNLASLCAILSGYLCMLNYH